MIELELPWPAAELSPNARVHWRTRAPLQATARLAAYVTMRHWLQYNRIHVGDRLPVTMIFCPPDRRGRDLDNLGASMKWALDGVASALNIDDRNFRPVTSDWGEVCKPGKVILKIGDQP